MFTGYCETGATGAAAERVEERGATRMIHDFYDTDPARGFYGGGGAPGSPGIRSAMRSAGMRGLAPGDPTWGPEYKRLLRESYSHSMVAAGHTDRSPRRVQCGVLIRP